MQPASSAFTHLWEEIAEQLVREQDPTKALALVKKLNDAMLEEEREKVRRRLFGSRRGSLQSAHLQSQSSKPQNGR